MNTKGLVTAPWLKLMKRSREPEIGSQVNASEADGGQTSPTLLDRVRDWEDHPAWMRFFERYQPLLRRWCGRFGLDDDASDELCQRIWVELMARMRTFRYDPSRGFRGWLWRLFRSRAIDLLRHRRTTQPLSLDGVSIDEWMPGRDDPDPTDDGPEAVQRSVSLILFRQAEEAQEAVRSRVDPETWRAYWLVAIEDQPLREAAESLGKSYTAVYTGYKRVDRMLRQEGQRRRGALARAVPESCGAD
jgi:RNA polymerase sigma factor (sigma-70 family)